MTKETDQHRYIFSVRQRFGEEPKVDSFYELQVPAGLTSGQAQVMKKLDDRFCKDEIASDTAALSGMELRLRFNSDIYQKVCLVRCNFEIDADTLDSILQVKHQDGELLAWLKESAIN